MEVEVDNVEDFLAHYGIKGMRWGVRRPVGKDGLVGSGGSSKTSAGSNKTKDGKIIDIHGRKKDSKPVKRVLTFRPDGSVSSVKVTRKAAESYLKKMEKYAGRDLTNPRNISKLNKYGDKLMTNLSFRIENGQVIPDFKQSNNVYVADYIDKTLRAQGYRPMSELQKKKEVERW